jgi:hypothetical protein
MRGIGDEAHRIGRAARQPQAYPAQIHGGRARRILHLPIQPEPPRQENLRPGTRERASAAQRRSTTRTGRSEGYEAKDERVQVREYIVQKTS